MLPYVESIYDDYTLRIFDSKHDHADFVWHRDREDRIVSIIECGDNWMYQEDNKVPIDLFKNQTIKILKNTYHRVIPGSGKLVIIFKPLF